MRYAICVSLLIALALPGEAQDEKAKPNTLTPKETADGWILLFDGETTFGWKAGTTEADVKPGLKVANGALVLSGLTTYANVSARFHYFEIAFEYRTEGSKDAHFTIGTPGDWPKRGHLMGYGLQEGHGAAWAHARFRVVPGELTYRQERPGKKPLEGKTPLSKDFGISELQFSPDHDKEGTLFLRNIKVRPLNTKSLFDGKDLTGWREFPGKKSKFTVTDKGELNVKDGPGDLQTAGKYKDFILQLECISNGKHLNSGIFFRCRDNEYQNGYEAQIRNQFTDKPTQKYLIEEYDPKTNKLLGKKEIMSTAFDFGTGAIYRRMPARKQMSKDNEWFAMTIVAHGNHLATWVNGVQVADWTDHRPKSDNARTGCKLEAGHISIQGHDPSTDLSFRNLRIAELPAEK